MKLFLPKRIYQLHPFRNVLQRIVLSDNLLLFVGCFMLITSIVFYKHSEGNWERTGVADRTNYDTFHSRTIPITPQITIAEPSKQITQKKIHPTPTKPVKQIAPALTTAPNFPTSVPAQTQANLSGFSTLSAGSALLSDSECAGRVKRSSWEPRPQNAGANQSVGITGIMVDGASGTWNSQYAGRINGNFTGTTDEIIQWGSCKWGFNTDIVRAVAAQESWWRQSHVGDNGESFGLLQVRNPYHKGTYPASHNSTAYNVDYALAWRRACFDGDFSWMREKNAAYTAGDEWGCVGAWFSGNWYDGDVNTPYSGANWYISQVKVYYNLRYGLSLIFYTKEIA